MTHMLYICAVLCLTLCNSWTNSRQAPLSMEFSRQEYWSGLPFPTPEDLHNGVGCRFLLQEIFPNQELNP